MQRGVSHKSYKKASIKAHLLLQGLRRGTKLERFLHKNQHAQRKLLNFENWTSGEPQLAKIRVFKVDYFDFS